MISNVVPSNLTSREEHITLHATWHWLRALQTLHGSHTHGLNVHRVFAIRFCDAPPCIVRTRAQSQIDECSGSQVLVLSQSDSALLRLACQCLHCTHSVGHVRC